MDHLREEVEIGDKELLLHAATGEEGGVVVDEAKAIATPCTGYRADTREMLAFSPGVIGNLSKAEREKYCKRGITWKTSVAVTKRWTKFREAIKAAQARYIDGDIVKWLSIVGEELRKRGVRI